MSRLSAQDEARIAASVAYFEADVGPIPPTVAAALPSFVWDKGLMRAHPAPIEHIPICALVGFLKAPVWRRPGCGPFTLAPVEVGADPVRFASQLACAMRADLSYPIEMICLGDGRRLADGYHRLLKATLVGRRTIRARVIPESAIPSILADPRSLPPTRGA